MPRLSSFKSSLFTPSGPKGAAAAIAFAEVWRQQPLPGESVSNQFWGSNAKIYGNYVLASGNTSGPAAKLLDASTGTVIRNFGITGSQLYSTDSYLALNDTYAVISTTNYLDGTTGRYGRVRVLDLSTGSTVVDILPSRSFQIAGNETPGFGRQVRINSLNQLVISTIGTESSDDTFVDVYDASTGGLSYTVTNPAAATANHRFGQGIDIDDQYLVISAPVAGSVFVFNASNGELIRTINSPISSAAWGWAVAISSNRILISDTSTPASLVGRAYLYDRLTGNQLFEFTNPNPWSADLANLNNDMFGESVALNGAYAVVSASRANAFIAPSTTQGNTGFVAIYSTTSGQLVQVIGSTPTYNTDTLAIRTGWDVSISSTNQLSFSSPQIVGTTGVGQQAGVGQIYVWSP